MNPWDIIDINIIAAVLIIIGAFGLIWLVKPLDKVIMLNLMEVGFLLTVVSAKYLDVAFAIAIFTPISTMIILFAIIKINTIRKENSNTNLNDNNGSDDNMEVKNA
ncbi:MAG: DUF2108 domain-containing protein [Methanobacteriaceae archaeon]